ncbi:UDP-N-acetylmuramoyl-L-alanyl-D-glutamate--2,6-diaminopimelate ligase [Marinicrinis sediminis]|uniref:UDP-N-acetylmuramoyl-L-alanyl-D-glutamate--2,6-diaminopimelate ligase n=1 Tax=Marinicrinis sediminis TaxID=1652465 RepID=A0ABW5RBD2_9BACL
MKLQELADLLLTSRVTHQAEIEISGIQTDSRKVQAGDLFICLVGYQTDGHLYAEQAIQAGAVALLTERELEVEVPQLIVSDSRFAMARVANHFYQYPSQKLKLIGVTGTNGKTTITYLLDQILSDQQKQTGIMGTIQMKIGNETVEAKNTTQEALELQQNLKRMLDAGCEYGVMEVSSHALELGRVKGCHFKTAIFTNLTQDHLDFHETMEQYRAAKSLLFSRLGNAYATTASEQQFAVLNADDPASRDFAKVTAAQVLTYGIDQPADVRATQIRMTQEGTTFSLESFAGNRTFTLKLMGKFSVYNALAAITAALAEGIDLDAIHRSLQSIAGVNGRFEAVQEGQDFLVIVDYAHTPDSLENVLKTIQELAEGRIITVFGCGGDRDRGKRPIMGEMAGTYSDYVWITSDNPRTEDPGRILTDIEPGVQKAGLSRQQYEIEPDRKQAIEKAIHMATAGDVILIAGKGHETYQEIHGVRHDFDDRLVAKEAIRRLVH